MSNLEEKFLDGPRVSYIDNDDSDRRVGGEENDAGSTEITSEEQQSEHQKPSLSHSQIDASGSQNSSGRPKLSRSKTINTCSLNTGPKGVIQDFKQHVTQTDRHPQSAISESDLLDLEFNQLMSDDSILEQVKQERLKQETLNSTLPNFGFVSHVSSGDQFLSSVDSENPNVTVVCHVYRKFSQMCITLNKHLDEISRKFTKVKFICIDAAVVGLSNNFIENGVPALLVYKGGNLIKSLVRLEDSFDRDFDIDAVKDLLRQNNVI